MNYELKVERLLEVNAQCRKCETYQKAAGAAFYEPWVSLRLWT